MTKLIKLICLLCVSMTISACAGIGIANNDLRWTEEVKLSDGSVIQLERKTEFTSHSGFPANSRGLYKSHEICYPPLNIRWKSKGSYRPDVFDIVDGRIHIHLPIYDCFQCMLNDYPETDALYFVWNDGAWSRIPHSQFPAASEWNLLWDSQAAREEDDVRGYLTLAGKLKDRDKSLRYEQTRKGWKRLNAIGKGIGRCNACRSIKTTTDATPEIFLNDGKSSCQP